MDITFPSLVNRNINRHPANTESKTQTNRSARTSSRLQEGLQALPPVALLRHRRPDRLQQRPVLPLDESVCLRPQRRNSQVTDLTHLAEPLELRRGQVPCVISGQGYRETKPGKHLSQIRYD